MKNTLLGLESWLLMRLPNNIEKAITSIEADYMAYTKQHAGTPRLRELRWAIEEFMRKNSLKWDSGAEEPAEWR